MGAVARDGRLAAADVHREHRHKADRYERHARVGRGEQGGSEGEHAARRPGLEGEVVAQVGDDRQARQQRAGDAGQHMVDGEERRRGEQDDRQLSAGDVAERQRLRDEQDRAGGDHREQVLRGVEEDLERRERPATSAITELET